MTDTTTKVTIKDLVRDELAKWPANTGGDKDIPLTSVAMGINLTTATHGVTVTVEQVSRAVRDLGHVSRGSRGNVRIRGRRVIA